MPILLLLLGAGAVAALAMNKGGGGASSGPAQPATATPSAACALYDAGLPDANCQEISAAMAAICAPVGPATAAMLTALAQKYAAFPRAYAALSGKAALCGAAARMVPAGGAGGVAPTPLGLSLGNRLGTLGVAPGTAPNPNSMTPVGAGAPGPTHYDPHTLGLKGTPIR